MSAETVQDIIVKTYSILLRLNNFFQNVISLKNMQLTVKVLLSSVVVFIMTYLVSDAFFLWVLTNLVMSFPLAYNKKKKQIDSVLVKMNDTIDKYVSSSSFLMKIQRDQTAQEKKQL